MAKLYFEDFAVGDVAEYGDALVTADEIKAFAADFDPQPMHLDEEAAKKTIVGGLCASGWHTCCLMMRMVVDGFISNSSSMGAPGVEEIRWLAPVRPGDRLRVRTNVSGKTRAEKSSGFRFRADEVRRDKCDGCCHDLDNQSDVRAPHAARTVAAATIAIGR